MIHITSPVLIITVIMPRWCSQITSGAAGRGRDVIAQQVSVSVAPGEDVVDAVHAALGPSGVGVVTNVGTLQIGVIKFHD